MEKEREIELKLVPKEKLKNSMGNRLLRGLFYEQADKKETAVYTLKDRDHKGYPSLYRLYMEADDLTEYEFAVKHLDGWQHWKILSNSAWFKPYVKRWREELETRTKGKALARIIAESGSKSRSAAGLNKWLVEGGWKDKPTKGRPSKAEVKKAAKEEAENAFQIKQDYKLLKEKVH